MSFDIWIHLQILHQGVDNEHNHYLHQLPRSPL